MTSEEIILLEASIDQPVEFVMLDGTRFLGTPLFVYTGEENPDVFLLPISCGVGGGLVPAKEGQSILLEDIRSVHLMNGPPAKP